MGATITKGKLITVSFPLFVEESTDELGVVTIYGTDAFLRDEMIHQLPLTILSELTKTVTAAIFLLICFYLLFG